MTLTFTVSVSKASLPVASIFRNDTSLLWGKFVVGLPDDRLFKSP